MSEEANTRLAKLKQEATALFHGNAVGALQWLRTHRIKALNKPLIDCIENDRDMQKALGEISKHKVSSS